MEMWWWCYYFHNSHFSQSHYVGLLQACFYYLFLVLALQPKVSTSYVINLNSFCAKFYSFNPRNGKTLINVIMASFQTWILYIFFQNGEINIWILLWHKNLMNQIFWITYNVIWMHLWIIFYGTKAIRRL